VRTGTFVPLICRKEWPGLRSAINQRLPSHIDNGDRATRQQLPSHAREQVALLVEFGFFCDGNLVKGTGTGSNIHNVR
jgi:hypothetical protein